jgi:DNA-binding NtrC family response regulator
MRSHTVLVVEDHETTREALQEVLKRQGNEVVAVDSVKAAKGKLSDPEFDVVLTDLRLPDGGDRGGLEVLELSIKMYPGRPVLLLTAHGSVDTAVEAMKMGAYDYLEKPLDLRRLRQVLDGAFRLRDLQLRNDELSRQLGEAGGPSDMVGDSPQMLKLGQEIAQVARTSSTVLITGESGSGKELIANAIHRQSPRCHGPMIRVHLGALPRDLIESELFGHERGAFTGAVKRKIGRFELADGGTLFLDEVAEMPLQTQVKLLRVLETRQFERVGGTATVSTDIRLLAATHADLKSLVAKGLFREDLYFRINVLSIEAPALRDRSGDVKLLVDAFSLQFSDARGRNKKFAPDAITAMEKYEWPGNVRELRNVVERLAVIVGGPVVTFSDLPEEIRRAGGSNDPRSGLLAGSSNDVFSIKVLEKDAIIRAMDACKGVKKKAAGLLGIGVRTLYRKIDEYDIQ